METFCVVFDQRNLFFLAKLVDVIEHNFDYYARGKLRFAWAIIASGTKAECEELLEEMER